MNLKVYAKDGSFRTLGPIRSFSVEFDRNTFHVDYRAGNGTMTHEDGELHTLFPEGETPNFMFDFALNEMGDEMKLGITGKRGALSGKERVSSGVGHLTDPTTVPTGGLTDKFTGEGQDDPRTAVNEASTEFTEKNNEARTSAGLKKTDDESLKRIQERLKEINEKENKEKPKEAPKSFSVPVASAVGTLVDPGSQDTGKLDKGGNVQVPNAPENKQGTTKFEINK